VTPEPRLQTRHETLTDDASYERITVRDSSRAAMTQAVLAAQAVGREPLRRLVAPD
jgi:hypothetical protein